MTVTMQNVDVPFLEVLKSLVKLHTNVVIKQVTDEENEEPNRLTAKVLRDSEAGKNLSQVFTSTSDFMAALNA